MPWQHRAVASDESRRAIRAKVGLRDMALALGLTVTAVLLVVGLYAGFRFSPAGPSSGQTPSGDAVGAFDRADRVLPFDPVTPRGLPADWHANSAAITPATADKPATVRGGWLVPSGQFVGLVASDVPVAELLRAEISGASSVPDTTVTAGDRSWQVSLGRRGEQVWLSAWDGVSYLITGSADTADFRVLAASLG